MLITLFFAAWLSAEAQLKFGLKGGVHFSSVGIEGYGTRTAPHIGALLQLKVSKFAVQPEVILSYQGAGSIQLAYVSVPVMGQYYIAKGLNVEVGPQVSFLTYAHDETNGGPGDIKDLMDKVDFGLNFGAAYKLPVTPFGFYARYSLGLTELFENDVPRGLSGGRNKLFQLGAFVKF